MKRAACAMLALALVLSILAGCAVSPSTQQVSCGELQLELPLDYGNMYGKGYDSGLDLAYTNRKQSILAVSEPRSVVAGYNPKIDSARAYAYAFIATNELSCEPAVQDGLVTFTYASSAEGVTITYLCGVYMGKDRFWVVQNYCEDADFAASKDGFLRILKSVRVN